MADSQHTIRHALNGEGSPPSRRALITGASTAVAVAGLGGASPIASAADETVSHCRRWLAMESAVDKLWEEWADIEVKLSKENVNFFELSDQGRHRLPGGGGRMLEIEQTAEQLRFERDALLTKLPGLKAHTPEAILAKLTVASRLIVPEHDPEAHRIVQDSIRNLRRLRHLRA